MKRTCSVLAILASSMATAALLAGSGRSAAADDDDGRRLLVYQDDGGQVATVSTKGRIDFDNPFFEDLGSNRRRCVTCHQPANAWSITPASVQARFNASNGDDPIFANNDGSNCEGVVPHTRSERLKASSLLLTRGLIRVGLDVPPGADFAIDKIVDPFHCGPSSNDASLYRRPLPATNLRFLSAVMWDGRESAATTTILQDLAHQANDATRGHAQATRDLTPQEIERIVEFESSLYTAQIRDDRAGRLDAHRAHGGVAALATEPFFIGINDPVNLNPTGAAFDRVAFTLFDGWRALSGSHEARRRDAQLAIARGEAIFNTKPIAISGVAGLNGHTFPSGVTMPSSFSGTCTTCHDTPNAGSHSVKAPLDIGIADPARAPYLPVYTLRNLATQQTVETTDPGRAMITGKWDDIGKFKGPVLRALAARAPYFHNGSAATLEDVVDFYDTRFAIGLTAQEKADLVAFLRAL